MSLAIVPFTCLCLCLSLIQLRLVCSCFMSMASAQVTVAFVAGDCDISMLSLRKQRLPPALNVSSINQRCPTSYGVFLLFEHYIQIELNSISVQR